ncbi:MAG: alpha-amylase [Calditrichaeota bacterium]|nr:MAG: alpha-amylase [Calditrichota bacterium]
MAKETENFVPEWAKKVVWYQIFPERFHNGDKSNDPKLIDQKGAYPHDLKSDWEIHPWTSDWYELQPYEKKNGKDIWFNIQRRRYGGDIQGIIDKLDYLQDLGISALYLNPIFESPSSHKYDGKTFHHIDPNFGPNPDEDRELMAQENPADSSTWVWTSADKLVLKLIREVHKRKMRIIFDGVFNHMGIESFAFKDVKKNQRKSVYKNWFEVTSWRDKEKGTKFFYNGWYGVRELPEIKEDENGIVAEPKKYIFEATKRWLDPNGDGSLEDGIDGWRLDVAFCIKHPFWKDWRRHVKAINPEAYLTAEVIEPLNELLPFLEGDEFDAMMNYCFAFASADFFFDEKTQISPTEFDKTLEEIRNAFPSEVAYVMQNLFGSHDSNRIASHIVNRDKLNYKDWSDYFNFSKGENLKYDTRKPNQEEIALQKLFVIFQMTYVGAPMIYYGDEVGIWGANDPDCRKPMIWKEFEYQDEVLLPTQEKRPKADKVEINEDLFTHYKKLIGIRNSNLALQIGDYKTLLTDDEKNVLAFSRSIKDQKFVVILNKSAKEQKVNLNLNGNYEDILNGDRFSGNEIIVKPKWARILVMNND